MLLKAGSSSSSSAEDSRIKRPPSGLVATGTTTTVSSSHGKGFSRNGSKMAVSSSGSPSVANNVQRIHRKGIRTASKRFPGKSMPGKLHTVTRLGPGKIMKNPGKRLLQRPNPPICDNSNDSGLGFDNQELSGAAAAAAAAYHAQMGIANSNRTNGTSLGTNSATIHHQQLLRNHPVAGTSSMGHEPTMATTTTSSLRNARSSSAEEAAKRRSRGGGGGGVGAAGMGGVQSAMSMASGVSNGMAHIQMDTDDACSNDAFIFAQQQRMHQQQQQQHQQLSPSPDGGVNEMLATVTTITTPSPGKLGGAGPKTTVRRQTNGQVNMQQQGAQGLSKNGRYQLQILAQPEQQHRARYQTEGSRGAVKDRSGNSFPIVRLQGYDKPAVLEVFIGTDVGRVAPHMFYQACKVSGKNSTPCVEKKVDGTMIIELELRPDQDMMVTCDCVGILKERNVDVEHRFPDQSSQRSKKKSTRCRMVFRATITNDDGTTEMLQVGSQPIICTQPPGVPEICKKSLISCPVLGGFELFIIGKNFAKDTKIIFQSQKITGELLWQEIVIPDKEYLQQTHLICTIPPYVDKRIQDPVTVQMYAMANGRKSEYHNFVYTPKEGPYSAMPSYSLQSHIAEDLQCLDLKTTDLMAQNATVTNQQQQQQQQQSPQDQWSTGSLQEATDCGMMPPPNAMMSLNLRRSSSGGILSGALGSDQHSPTSSSGSSSCSLKVEIHDESSQSSLGEVTLIMPPETLAVVKQEELVAAAAQQLVAQQQHNQMLINMTNQVSAAAPVAPAPIQFTDQQLTTISQAINATTTNPATSSVLDVGATLHMDTNPVSSVQPVNLMVPPPNCTASDIILNSHSAILGATTSIAGVGVPGLETTTANGVVDHSNISPDVILNPQVTPSLLCESLPGGAVPVVSASVVPSMVVDPMLGMPPQPVVTSASSGDATGGLLVDPMIGNSPTAGAALNSPQSPNGGLATTAEVVQNVQNMILNAAAEILVSQQTTISNESMQAIISLNNAASMLNDQPQPAPQVETVAPGIFTNPTATSEAPNMAMMVRRNSNILAENVATNQGNGLLGVTGGDIHMRTVHDDMGHLTGAPVTMNPATSGMVVNDLLLTNTASVSQSVGIVGADVAVPGSLVSNGGVVENAGVVVPTTSNALMVALSGPIMGSQPGVPPSVVGGEVKTVVNAGPGQQPPASIPQEIATMSEHDLISYINPNCFDQEFQNI